MGILGGLIPNIFGAVKDVVSEVVVDKDKRNQLNADLMRMQIEFEDKAEARVAELQLAQIEVNKEESKSDKLFVAGWRPAVGWICAFGLAWATLLQPMFSWTAVTIFEYVGDFPEVDSNLLIFVLGGILGLGGMRSFEKVKGVASEGVNTPTVVVTDSPKSLMAAVEDAKVPEDAPWLR